MKTRAALVIALAVTMSGYIPVAQGASSAHYESILQNARVQVFRLTLPPGARSPVYLANHDQVWIALTDSELELRSGAHHSERVGFRLGDTRFIRRGSVSALTQNSARDAELIVAVINERDHESAACDCTGNIAQMVCGCGRTGELPPLWAVAVGNMTLAGITLNAGQTYPEPVDRNDMLLVAITPLSLRDLRDNSGARNVKEWKLNSGEAAWIPAGRHRFANAADAPGRFVTLEF